MLVLLVTQNYKVNWFKGYWERTDIWTR